MPPMIIPPKRPPLVFTARQMTIRLASICQIIFPATSKPNILQSKEQFESLNPSLKILEMAEEFLLYSDCLIAIDRWNTNDYLPEDNIEVCWISRNSDGIKVADTLAYRKRITTLI